MQSWPATRFEPRFTLVPPLRSAAAGCTFAPRREAPAKNEMQGKRMAAKRKVSYVMIET